MKRGAGVLLIKDGKVLLVKAGKTSKQLDGELAFPGGTIEPGESEIETAARELTEETGLTAKDLTEFPGGYVETNIVVKSGPIDFSFKVYLAQNYTGELKSSDETEPFWVDIDEAQKMKLLGKNNEILNAAINFLKL